MEVNDINNLSNDLNVINNQATGNSLVGKTGSASPVDNEKDSLRLTINQYNQRRDELSASLQAYTQGIGVTTVAQNGLQNQTEYLKNIESQLTDIRDNNESAEDKNVYKEQMNQELDNFRLEAANTRYNNENLLVVGQYEDDPTISINTREANYSINKPNTPIIATQVSQSLNGSDLNNPDALLGAIQTVDSSIKTIEKTKDDFNELQENLKQSARESIQEQMTLSNENRKNKEVNFGKESDDFSKNNVMANMGYLAASQANIVQEQSVRLLS